MREPPKPLRRFAGLFESIDWLAAAVQWLIEESLNLQHGQEQLVQMTDQLQGDLDRNTAATNAASEAITTEIQQLKDALAQLSTNQAPTQAQLDQLNASSDRLEAATAALAADDPTQAPPAA